MVEYTFVKQIPHSKNSQKLCKKSISYHELGNFHYMKFLLEKFLC